MKKYWLALLVLVTLARCAQQVAPTGGEKDTVPPKLVLSTPENKALNFKGKSIELLFDEYVILDNIQQKLTITPEAENPYTVKNKGKLIQLNFKNDFNDSTTYTFNFGDAIRDFSERNPAQNLKLVFSTGATIDSARLYGRVTDLQTNLPVFDAMVGLYLPKDTLNPEKQKPYYFSRTDSSGFYAIENIQSSQRYRLIAISDKNRNQLYNAREERIAFLDSAISVNADSSLYDLKLFASDVTPPRIQRTIPKVNSYAVVFSKSMDSIRVQFGRGDSLPYILETSTQLKFFNVGTSADTTVARLTGTDSLGQALEVEQKIAFLPQRGKERQRDPFALKTTPDRNQPLARDVRYTFSFSKPIGTLQPERIQLISDSTSRQSLSNITWQWNRYRNEINVQARATARDTIRWDIPKGAVISVEGDTLPATLIKHPVMKDDDYGIIRGSVRADSATAYIVELLDKEYKVRQTTYTSPYTFTRIPPGEYYLRLIVDRNRNRRWDTGVFNKSQQPEPIIYFPDPIMVKSNFEYEDLNFTVPSKTSD
ncbi:Ig-like domain-containing protein [Telluribacter sp. SYSU D00476]|uniref:Ig-like domain-containing protein n=1 Tax=Telluribacter sp. SYSU D00476 TaxID=2811430 RepID=UPI001FF2DC22|nr:Ig-like domain-containing protein [Telluribacter sp. SYSU D00476]